MIPGKYAPCSRQSSIQTGMIFIPYTSGFLYSFLNTGNAFSSRSVIFLPVIVRLARPSPGVHTFHATVFRVNGNFLCYYPDTHSGIIPDKRLLYPDNTRWSYTTLFLSVKLSTFVYSIIWFIIKKFVDYYGIFNCGLLHLKETKGSIGQEYKEFE